MMLRTEGVVALDLVVQLVRESLLNLIAARYEVTRLDDLELKSALEALDLLIADGNARREQPLAAFARW